MSNPPSEPLDAEAIKAKLEALKSEHRDLDEVIDRLIEKPPFDQLQLQRLKKRKLGLKDHDRLLAIVQMPAGIPVGTLAIGRAGAINAALLAASIVGLGDVKIMAAVERWRARQTGAVARAPSDEAAASPR